MAKDWFKKPPPKRPMKLAPPPVVQAIGVIDGIAPVLLGQSGQPIQTFFAPGGTGSGSTGATGATGSTGATGATNLLVFNTFADLKAGGPGAVGDAAILNGYYVSGDGGGGTLAWNAAVASGDDIVVIQPTGVVTGGWVRVFEGAVDVKWGGAYGDGSHDDTAAIQAVLNVVLPTVVHPGSSGNILDVYMPAGVYNVTAAANAPALNIARPTNLQGAGGGISTTQSTRIACSGVAPTSGGSCAICVEGTSSAASGSRIDGLLVQSRGPNLEDGIVIHASGCTVSNCTVANVWRYGFVASSGTTGTSGSAVGASAQPGNSVNAHFNQFLDCFGLQCGDITPTLGGNPTVFGIQLTASFVQPAILGTVTVQVNTTAPFNWDGKGAPIGIFQLGVFGTNMYQFDGIVDGTHMNIINVGAADSNDVTLTPPGGTVTSGQWFNTGAGLIIYGADANGCYVRSFNDGDCCNGTINGAQGSTTFIACYAQGTYYSHIDGNAGQSAYFCCNQETAAECILQLNAQILVVGGSCATSLKGGGNDFPAIVAPTNSSNTFQRLDGDGATYSFGCISAEAFMYLTRNKFGESPAQVWSFRYQEVEDSYTSVWGGPFHKNSWIWDEPVTSLSNGEQPFAPLGFTDTQNARGTGLPFISTPSMNTPMHFSWKQAVTLASGANTVYLNGGTGGDGGAVPSLLDPTIIQMSQTVFITGPGAPAVTFTGTPAATISALEIDITGGGTTFTWKLNGATQATGVAIAPTVALGATGITAHFPVATYTNGQTYVTSSQWGHAQRKMNVELEFASADLAAADCEVSGYAFVSEGSNTYNAAVKIKNNAGSPVNATVVWTYDVFVTNYDSGNIG